MKIEDIKTVLVIGSGTMGQQIGFLSAANGYRVNFYDIEEKALQNARISIEQLAEKMVAKHRLEENHVTPSIDRITFTTNATDAGSAADFVSESIPEDPNLKGKVFAEFNAICPKHAIFTTNTSSLVPSMFAEATGRPDKFAAFHFHNILQNNLVDIMPHPGTSPETISVIRNFAKRLDLIPIMLKKENPGYLFNTMFGALLRSAQTLVTNGIASYEDVDRAWMGVMGSYIGPFGLMDSVGLDTAWKIADYWASERNDPDAKKNADFLKAYVEKGYVGVKNKRGFYTYPKPAFMAPGFLKGDDD